MLENSKLLNALSNIDSRIHENGVTASSAIGIWSLATYLSATYNSTTVPAEVKNLLGMEPEEALGIMGRLLAETPEVVSFALGGWSPEHSQGVKTLFQRTMDIAENHSQSPSKVELDEWTNEKTLGIFDEFPFDVAEIVSVFASVVATDIEWAKKFLPHPGSVSLDGKRLSEIWKVEKILKEEQSQVQFFAYKGNTYVNFAKSDKNDSLMVHSTLALTPEGDEQVQQASNAFATGSFDNIVPLENTPTAQKDTLVELRPTESRVDTFDVELPAWDALAKFDVNELFPEFSSLTAPLMPEYSAATTSGTQQAVKASYNTKGFKAAAVTATMIRAVSMPVFRAKHYAVNFCKPFAVTATMKFSGSDIPLFSFLVNDAVEAEKAE